MAAYGGNTGVSMPLPLRALGRAVPSWNLISESKTLNARVAACGSGMNVLMLLPLRALGLLHLAVP